MAGQEEQYYRNLLHRLRCLCVPQGQLIVTGNVPKVLLTVIKQLWVPHGVDLSHLRMPANNSARAMRDWLGYLIDEFRTLLGHVPSMYEVRLDWSNDDQYFCLTREPSVVMHNRWRCEYLGGNCCGTLQLTVRMQNLGSSLVIEWDTGTGLPDPWNFPSASALVYRLDCMTQLPQPAPGLRTVLLRVDESFHLRPVMWDREGGHPYGPLSCPTSHRITHGDSAEAQRHPIMLWPMHVGTVVPLRHSLVAVAAPVHAMAQLHANIGRTSWEIVLEPEERVF